MELPQNSDNAMARPSGFPAASRYRRAFRQTFPRNVVFSVAALAALALSAGTVLAGADSKPTPEPNLPFFTEPVPDHPLNQSLNPEIYAEGLEEAIETIQIASVNLTALEYVGTGDGSGVRTSLVRGVPGQALTLRLPGHDRPLTLQISRTEQEGDVRSLSGKVAGHPSSLFTITLHGASVLAKIHLGPNLYVLEHPPGLGAHILKVVDKRRIPAAAYDDDVVVYSSTVKRLGKTVRALTGTKSLPENGNVRILFLYTPAVQNRNNITTLTNNIIAETNASLLDSSVAGHFYLTKAGANVLSDSFDGDNDCNDVIHTWMHNDQNEFSNLSNDMDAVYADIALAIVTTDGTLTACHDVYGRIGGASSNFNPDSPNVVTTDTYAIGDLTAPHEIGHYFGGKHEDPQCNGHRTDVPSSACGWVPDSGPYFQTMMGAYKDDNCTFDGLSSSCERIAYWSDPNLFVNGEYIGDSGARMVDALQGTSGKSATMGVVARQWDDPNDPDPYPYSRPSAPSSLTVHDEQCYGLHTVSWSSSTNADHYQLLRSLSSSFSSPEVIHRGTATTTGITVDSGTWYLRARACNGDGCSDVGVQKSASYYPGCN